MANGNTNTAAKSKQSKAMNGLTNTGKSAIGKQNRLDILVQTVLDYLGEGGSVTFASMEGGGVVIELRDVYHDEENKRLVASSASSDTGKLEVRAVQQ